MRTGIDIAKIERFNQKIDDEAFLTRVFTAKECEHIRSHRTEAGQAERMAGKFCAKEAVAKALGCGIGSGVNFIDIEILPNNDGAPVVFLHNYAEKIFSQMSAKEIAVSISHEAEYAVANCIII